MRKIDRRTVIKSAAISAAGVMLPSCSSSKSTSLTTINQTDQMFHSVCRWCYSKIPLEELTDQAKAIGIHSIELLDPSEWDIVLSRGLKCAISNGSKLGITKGFNELKHHDKLLKDFKSIIPKAADKGIEKIICFSGNRNGISDEMGLENCARGLEPVLKLAKKHNVQIVMELLNSKVDHIDYQCDRTSWGVALVEKLGSSHFNLLYDIYHMQIMEGDVIRTIRQNIDYISHFHTGGVPGRNELDLPQELDYRSIIGAIKETGFEGYVAQEFIPTRMDPFVSLRIAIDICST